MTRTDKVKAYNVLALNQRRNSYRSGSDRWQQCCKEMIEEMNRLTKNQINFVNHHFYDKQTDWVDELSKL